MVVFRIYVYVFFDTSFSFVLFYFIGTLLRSILVYVFGSLYRYLVVVCFLFRHVVAYCIDIYISVVYRFVNRCLVCACFVFYRL